MLHEAVNEGYGYQYNAGKVGSSRNRGGVFGPVTLLNLATSLSN
jgi:hypothetical protein